MSFKVQISKYAEGQWELMYFFFFLVGNSGNFVEVENVCDRVAEVLVLDLD